MDTLTDELADLASPKQVHNIYLTLITLLFSFAYDSRTTQSDPTPESAWTICSLTPAFSALDPPPYPVLSPNVSESSPDGIEFPTSELTSTLVPSVRRTLAFPLHRNFALATQCLRDVSNAFRRGKRGVLRALLGIKDILDSHEVYYIYSKIWVDDLCSWVSRYARLVGFKQSVHVCSLCHPRFILTRSESTIQQIGESLLTLGIDKPFIGWDLPELEEATRSATHRVPDSDDEDGSAGAVRDSDDESTGPPSSSSSSSLTLSSSSSSDTH